MGTSKTDGRLAAEGGEMPCAVLGIELLLPSLPNRAGWGGGRSGRGLKDGLRYGLKNGDGCGGGPAGLAGRQASDRGRRKVCEAQISFPELKKNNPCAADFSQ